MVLVCVYVSHCIFGLRGGCEAGLTTSAGRKKGHARISVALFVLRKMESGHAPHRATSSFKYAYGDKVVGEIKQSTSGRET
jgi:hypothetical protein